MLKRTFERSLPATIRINLSCKTETSPKAPNWPLFVMGMLTKWY